jgi:hypothetical protein
VLDGPDHPYAFREVAVVAWYHAWAARWRHSELVRANIGCADGAQIECLLQIDADVADTAERRIIKSVVIEPACADLLLEHLWPDWFAPYPALHQRSVMLTTGRPFLFAAAAGATLPAPTRKVAPAPPAAG